MKIIEICLWGADPISICTDLKTLVARYMVRYTVQVVLRCSISLLTHFKLNINTAEGEDGSEVREAGGCYSSSQGS